MSKQQGLSGGTIAIIVVFTILTAGCASVMLLLALLFFLSGPSYGPSELRTVPAREFRLPPEP